MRSVPYQRFWLRVLGLGEYRIVYERVNHRGVYDAERDRVVNASIVSARIDHQTRSVFIDYTRRIGEPDLLHELTEALHLELPHEEIDPMCKELITARRDGRAEELVSGLGLGLRST